MFLLRMCFVVAAFIGITQGAAITPNVGIVGGYQVSLKDAPYIVALYTFNSFHCGGSLIHESFVLTAAHCVHGYKSSDVQVLSGTDRLNEGGYLVQVAGIITHHEFNNKTYINDIALLKLGRPIRDSYWKAGLIDLPKDRRFILEGTVVNVTGWGHRKDNAFVASNDLRQVSVPVVSMECCRMVYENLNDTQICAGVPGHDSCLGDSGGPLTYNGVQIGIVSYGNKCGIYPGVYTRTSRYLTWVKKVIEVNIPK